MRSFATLRTTEKPSPSELADARRFQCALDDVLHEADEGCVGVGRDAVAPWDAVSATAVDQAEAAAARCGRGHRMVGQALFELRMHLAEADLVAPVADGQGRLAELRSRLEDRVDIGPVRGAADAG